MPGNCRCNFKVDNKIECATGNKFRSTIWWQQQGIYPTTLLVNTNYDCVEENRQ